MDYMKEIEERIKENNLKVDLKKIELAFYFAEESHIGQYRKSGEDYIAHPVEVAKILIDLKMNTDTIVAGILHDIVEDTLITIADIKYNFGEDVANLVDGVTKLSSLPGGTKDQAENTRKMILAMTKDIRVIIIKLVDRLHNMRTLKYMSPEKQVRISKETVSVYAPLAHRLGIARIKWELEDLALRYLEPEKYKVIKDLIITKKDERKDYIDLFIQTLTKTLKELNIDCEVKGRFKHFYSIYKKMYEKGKEFDDIYDLMGVRIIVKNIPDCYLVLGSIHNKYTPVPGRFKDYIAVPKANNYQSIHTTIVGPLGKFIEIQIRTEEMERVAEDGIAAHWAYKENIKIKKGDRLYSWLKNILESQEDITNSEEFVTSVTDDLNKETVFVFSPKGDIKELRIGATVLDFAFAVHTQIGCKCIGAKVNGRIVPLDYKLNNGDRVEIITSNNSKGPSKDWLDIVATQGAKNKIKKFLKDETFEETIKTGKESLEKELSKLGVTLKELEENPIVIKHMEKNNLKTMDDFYYQAGEKRSRVDIIVRKFKDKLDRENQEKEITIEDILKKAEDAPKKKKSDQGIVIDGSTNTLIRFAKCCTPLPGDDIGGYITKVSGITIHLKSCKNFIAMVEHDSAREIDAQWDKSVLNTKANKYNYAFNVEVFNRQNIIMDIIKVISNHKINIVSINTNEAEKEKEKTAIIKLVIEISSKEDYDNLVSNLLKIKDVLGVTK